jgi:hypothetical protein
VARIVDDSDRRVFIGSCTNSRIEDLRAAARVVQGYTVASRVHAMVVPGSGRVKRQAEAEGLDRVFTRCGLRVARGGLQHVPRHESRHACPRRTVRLDEQPQLRGPTGEGGPHPPRVTGDGCRGGRGWALRRHPAWRYLSLSSARSRSLPDDRSPPPDGVRAAVAHTGNVAALDRANVDTDQIIPKQFLKRIERTGSASILFFDWRFLPTAPPTPPSNSISPIRQGASILLGPPQFRLRIEP